MQGSGWRPIATGEKNADRKQHLTNNTRFSPNWTEKVNAQTQEAQAPKHHGEAAPKLQGSGPPQPRRQQGSPGSERPHCRCGRTADGHVTAQARTRAGTARRLVESARKKVPKVLYLAKLLS